MASSLDAGQEMQRTVFEQHVGSILQADEQVRVPVRIGIRRADGCGPPARCGQCDGCSWIAAASAAWTTEDAVRLAVGTVARW